MTDRDWNWNWNDNWDWLRSPESGDDSQTEFESSESHEQTQAKTDESTHSQTIHRRALLQTGLVALGFTGASSSGVSAATAPENGNTGKHLAVGGETDEVWSQQQKLTASDGDDGDGFGSSVGVSDDGTTALIGAQTDDDRTGSAYVFSRSEGAWSQQQKLTAADGESNNNFGESVGLSDDGTTALIGASDDDGFTGSAYVFSRSEGAWSQQQKLTASDGDDGDGFGSSVGVSDDGTTALIGASGSESAYVFSRSEGAWSQQQKLTASDGDVDDFFGSSVGLSDDGTTALIGAEGDDVLTGSAYVFSRSEGAWSQQQKLTASDGSRGDFFGFSVGLSDDGTTALIGASGSESAYVFSRSEGAWSQQQKLTASDGSRGDFFGISVGVSDDGTTALIGAEGDDDNTGSAYVFSRSEGAWSQQQKLTASDGDVDDFFGSSVRVSDDGTTALIGAGEDDTSTGSAYVFTENGSTPPGGGGSGEPGLKLTAQASTGPVQPGETFRIFPVLTNIGDATTDAAVDFDAATTETTHNADYYREQFDVESHADDGGEWFFEGWRWNEDTDSGPLSPDGTREPSVEIAVQDDVSPGEYTFRMYARSGSDELDDATATVTVGSSLSIEDARLVQITENTRVSTATGTADETTVGDTDPPTGVPDPDLVLGRNTACVFDIAGPPDQDIDLSGDVEVTVSGDNLSFTNTDATSPSFLLNGDVVNKVVAETSLLDELAIRGDALPPTPETDLILDPFQNGFYPVFEATEDVSNIQLDLAPQDTDVAGDSVTLLGESGGDGSDTFVEMPSLDIGFIILHSPESELGGFGSVSAETYRQTVRQSAKYAQRVAPTPRVNFYRRSADEAVRATILRTLPSPEIVEDFQIMHDLRQAHGELLDQLNAGLPSGQLGTVTGGFIDETATPSLSSFDVTIAIVPPDYLPGEDVIGIHYGTPSGRISVAVATDADEATAIHEAGHYFLNDPFTGTFAQDTDRDQPPDPPEGRQGSDPAHAQDNLVSTRFDITGNTNTADPLTASSISRNVASYMSYVDDTWADSLTTQRLISSDNAFEYGRSEDAADISQDSPTLSVLARITDDGIAFRSREVRDEDIPATSIDTDDGTQIRVTDASGDAIITQTLPTEIVATPRGGETRVVEDVILGEIPYPAEASEVEISADRPAESGGPVTTRVDATTSLIAEFSLLDGPARVGDPATFDAAPSFTSTPDASIQEYEWIIDGDTTGQGETLVYTFSSGGSHQVELSITDSTGTRATTSQTISLGFSLAEFDRDNDGEIGFDDLRYATREYNRENISFEQLRRVLRAYNTDQQV